MTLSQKPPADRHLLGGCRRSRARRWLLPAMQFADPRELPRGPICKRKGRTPLVGAAAAGIAARGRATRRRLHHQRTSHGAIAFLGEVVIIAIVLSGIRLVHGRCHIRETGVWTSSERSCPRSAWAASSWGSSSGSRAAEPSVALDRGSASSRSARSGLVAPSSARREGKAGADRCRPLPVDVFPSRQSPPRTLQQIALGGLDDRPPRSSCRWCYEYSAMGAGLTLAPLSLEACSPSRLLAGKKGRETAGASKIIRAGFLLLAVGCRCTHP